jgi:hypothetical protein
MYNTSAIQRLITTRHKVDTAGGGQEWAVFFEMRNGTGARATERYVDALALNLWPSSGLRRIVYEIKTSRADFARELAQPQKRAWGLEISHEFWFACAHGVCGPTEIPENCGLLVATKDGSALKIVKHAPARTPRDWTAAEVAAIARRAVDREQFKGPRWQYAGQDLDAAALDAIIAAERPAADAHAIEERARALAAEATKPARECLRIYAGVLESASITPPAWMAAGDLNAAGKWDATDWARNLINPNAADLARRAGRELDTLSRHLEPIRAALRAIEEADTEQEQAS